MTRSKYKEVFRVSMSRFPFLLYHYQGKVPVNLKETTGLNLHCLARGEAGTSC